MTVVVIGSRPSAVWGDNPKKYVKVLVIPAYMHGLVVFRVAETQVVVI